jgi:hypothetical protein
LLKKEKISFFPEPVLIVGAVADGQVTVVHVTVRGEESWVKIIINDLPATAVGIVIVALPVSVKF